MSFFTFLTQIELMGQRERMSRARVIIPGKDQLCVFVKVTHGPFNPLTCGWVGVKMTYEETFQEQ